MTKMVCGKRQKLMKKLQLFEQKKAKILLCDFVVFPSKGCWVKIP